MPRNITDPNYDGTFEWQERVTDADGDSLSISVTVDGTDISNVSWADFTTTTNTINGDETEVLVDFTADRSGLTEGETYQFEVTADDGLATTTRTFQLEVTEPPGTTAISGDFYESTIRQYSLGTAYDVSTQNLEKSQDLSTLGASQSRVGGLLWDTKGSTLLVTDPPGNRLVEYSFGLSSDITSLSHVNTKDLSANIADYPQGMEISQDGTVLFVVESSSLHKYAFNTAWDTTTLNYQQTFSISNVTSVNGCTINKDTKKEIWIANYYGEIIPINLTSEFDLSTGTQNSLVIDTAGAPNLRDIGFNSNGSKFYVYDSGTDILTYPLGTNYDVSTHGSKSTATWPHDPTAVDFNN